MGCGAREEALSKPSVLTDHIVLMSVYAAILAAFLGLLWRDTPRERVRLGTRIFAALMVTGLAVAWAMYPG